MELFHWFERFAWRIAILLPIYQNCMTGHWEHGHRWFPIMGKVFHYVVGAWGIGFFVCQVLMSDVVRFYLFLNDKPLQTLNQILGIASPRIGSFHPFSYHGGLVLMWSMYLFLMVTGFKPFFLSLKAAGPWDKTSRSDDEEDLQRRNNDLASLARILVGGKLPTVYGQVRHRVAFDETHTTGSESSSEREDLIREEKKSAGDKVMAWI